MAIRPGSLLGAAARRLGLGRRRQVVVQLGRDGEPLLPPRELDFFPKEQPAPGQIRWALPKHMELDSRRWVQTLARLYQHPLSYPFSISPEAGMLLNAVVLNARPRVAIEIGSNIGVSALWMAGALHDAGAGALFCFDDFQPIKRLGKLAADQPPDRERFLRDGLAEAGVAERVEVFPGRSDLEVGRAAQRMIAAGGAGGRDRSSGVQLAFIDGDHNPEGVLRDFRAVEPLLDTGGLVVFHDTFPWMCSWDGPRRLLNTLHQHAAGTYQSIDLYLAPVNYGLAILRRIG